MTKNKDGFIEVLFSNPELINTLSPNSYYPVSTNCGDIMFVNQGTVTVFINLMPLPAGASITFGVNSGEIMTGTFRVSSATPVGNAGLYVFRKLYK